jgi:hypothetical protein
MQKIELARALHSKDGPQVDAVPVKLVCVWTLSLFNREKAGNLLLLAFPTELSARELRRIQKVMSKPVSN